MEVTKLPTVPSKLIRLALKDLAACEADSRYTIDMATWHYPQTTGPCLVCLAGVVMAQTIGVAPGSHATPESFPEEEMALLALDALRVGNVGEAFKDLVIENPPFCARDIVKYIDDPKLFKKDMEVLATDLQEAGF